MSKTVLITGSTDGIGLETAKTLAHKGHLILLHGRSRDKLNQIMDTLSMDGFLADLSNIHEVEKLANDIIEKYKSLDVIINNAGVFKAPKTTLENGLDIRFMVNTIAPYLLTKKLLPLLKESGRIINLSSAAQSTVNLNALEGKQCHLDDMEAYAQSKLALTMWSIELAQEIGHKGPAIIPVNPASLIGSKMVKEGFGVEGKDLTVGANILYRLAIDNEFSNKTGQYYDNDKGQFTSPHADVMDESKRQSIIKTIEKNIKKRGIKC